MPCSKKSLVQWSVRVTCAAGKESERLLLRLSVPSGKNEYRYRARQLRWKDSHDLMAMAILPKEHSRYPEALTREARAATGFNDRPSNKTARTCQRLAALSTRSQPPMVPGVPVVDTRMWNSMDFS